MTYIIQYNVYFSYNEQENGSKSAYQYCCCFLLVSYEMCFQNLLLFEAVPGKINGRCQSFYEHPRQSFFVLYI